MAEVLPDDHWLRTHARTLGGGDAPPQDKPGPEAPARRRDRTGRACLARKKARARAARNKTRAADMDAGADAAADMDAGADADAGTDPAAGAPDPEAARRPPGRSGGRPSRPLPSPPPFSLPPPGLPPGI